MQIARAIAGLMMALVGGVVAQPVPPVDQYRSDTEAGVLICRLTLESEVLDLQMAEKGLSLGVQPRKQTTAECLVEWRATGKKSMDRALRTVKKAQAREALKTVQVAFLSSLDGIRPAFQESKQAYASRQAALKDRQATAWARFEVEQ